MGTNITPEVSKKKKYWIPKHRYYELKHFVMQYSDWLNFFAQLNYYGEHPTDCDYVSNEWPSNPTEQIALLKEKFAHNIRIVDCAMKETHPEFGDIIVENIHDGNSYETSRHFIPISRNEYYDLYRKFFWLLDKSRC